MTFTYSDIQLSELTIRAEYYKAMLSGDFATAQSIYQTNINILKGKVMSKEYLNNLISRINTIERLSYNNIQNKLSDKLEDFRYSINDFIYMGEWDINKSYNANAFVIYNNDIYMAIKLVSAGTNITNTEYWLHLGLRGKAGNPTLGVDYKGAWDNTIQYSEKDAVVYNNNIYVAKSSNVNQNPETATTYWLKAVEMQMVPIYVSTTEPPNLTSGDIWIKIT